MMYNLIWELNKGLKFTFNIDDKQSAGTGDETRILVSKDITGLTEEDIVTISTICKKYDIKVMSWVFSVGVKEESTWSYPTGKIINVLTLYVKPILKWGTEWRRG